MAHKVPIAVSRGPTTYSDRNVASSRERPMRLPTMHARGVMAAESIHEASVCSAAPSNGKNKGMSHRHVLHA